MRTTRKSERGVTLIQVALLMVVMLGFTALTVDYGLMVVTQRHLQNSTDAAAIAVGPDLLKAKNVMDTRATKVLTANNVTDLNTVFITKEYNTGSGTYAYTITAQQEVSVPFASAVANMVQGWDGYHRVQGKTTVQGGKYINAASLRPLSNMVGWVKGFTRVPGKQLDLVVEMDSKHGRYHDDKGKKNDAYAYMVAIDMMAPGGVDKYKQGMKYGLTGELNIVKGDNWLDTARFNNNWQVSETLWQQATLEAIKTDYDSILNRAGAGTKYQYDTWDNFQTGNPRYVTLPVCNGETGQNRTKLQGYFGVWIEDIKQKTIDGEANQWVVEARYVEPMQRWEEYPGSGLPDLGNDNIFGQYGYRITQ